MSAPVQEQKKCSCCITECDILNWKNPVQSGKIFGGSLVFLLFIRNVNLLTFFTRIFYTVMITTGTVEFLSTVVLGNGNGLVTKYGIQNCPNTVGILKPYVDEALKQMPVKQAAMRKLVFAASPKATFKAAFVFWLLNKLFNWFSLTFLLLIIDISVFTLPIIYQKFQTEIDAVAAQFLKLANAQCEKSCTVLKEKLQPVCERLDAKLGPVSTFIKSRLATNEKKTETEAASTTAATAIAAATGSSFPSTPSVQPAATSAATEVQAESQQFQN